MYIDNVVIEITRRCNIQCPHCLRGGAEATNISDKTLDRFFFKVRDDRIGNLCITGGEPSLAPSRIKKIRYFAGLYHVSIDYFYIVTNAVKAPPAFISALSDLYGYVQCPESCTVVYSNDKFHEHGMHLEGRDKLEVFEFFRGGKDPKMNPLDYSNLIDMGSAKHNQMAQRELVLHKYDVRDGDIYDGTIYLNALGKILPSCDLSYEVQRDKSIILGDVFDEDFSLIRYAEQFNAKMAKLAPVFSPDAVQVLTFEPNGETVIDEVKDHGYIRPREVTITEFLEAA